MKGPYVLVGNHASWYDPLLAAVCADRPLCFCGADPEALGFDTRDRRGRRVDPNLLSASFSL